MRRCNSILIAALFATGVIVGCGGGAQPRTSFAPFHALFPGSTTHLVTNEYAYWNPHAADAVTSSDWAMTSGSLFARDGVGWSGRPDSARPDARSTTGTNSAVFRLTTVRRDFLDVRVSFRLRLLRLTATPTTPATAWDGLHVFLRYQSQTSLYYVSVSRRDGTVAIKKKVTGGPSNGGTYFELASAHHPFSIGAWHSVEATIATATGGGVQITLSIDGAPVLRADDHGTGGPPIRAPGRVGIRGDNAEFEFGSFRVRAGELPYSGATRSA